MFPTLDYFWIGNICILLMKYLGNKISTLIMNLSIFHICWPDNFMATDTIWVIFEKDSSIEKRLQLVWPVDKPVVSCLTNEIRGRVLLAGHSAMPWLADLCATEKQPEQTTRGTPVECLHGFSFTSCYRVSALSSYFEFPDWSTTGCKMKWTLFLRLFLVMDLRSHGIFN